MPKPKPSALTIAPDPQLSAIKSRATKLLKLWQECKVTDTVSFEDAGQALRNAVQIRKDLKSLPVYVELARQKADIKAKEKILKDVDKLIEFCEDTIRQALSVYASAQRAAQAKLIEVAMSKGKDEKAAVIAAQPFIPSVQGLSFTEHWHAEGQNIVSLAGAVSRGEVSPDALSFNLVWLNAQARSQQASMTIPGVIAVKETSSTVRT